LFCLFSLVLPFAMEVCSLLVVIFLLFVISLCSLQCSPLSSTETRLIRFLPFIVPGGPAMTCVLRKARRRQTDMTARYWFLCSSNFFLRPYNMRFAVRKLSRPNVLTPVIPSACTNSGIVKFGGGCGRSFVLVGKLLAFLSDSSRLGLWCID
jgi:hypothetical protein